jgi:hypothetical protein
LEPQLEKVNSDIKNKDRDRIFFMRDLLGGLRERGRAVIQARGLNTKMDELLEIMDYFSKTEPS